MDLKNLFFRWLCFDFRKSFFTQSVFDNNNFWIKFFNFQQTYYIYCYIAILSMIFLDLKILKKHLSVNVSRFPNLGVLKKLSFHFSLLKFNIF